KFLSHVPSWVSYPVIHSISAQARELQEYFVTTQKSKKRAKIYKFKQISPISGLTNLPTRSILSKVNGAYSQLESHQRWDQMMTDKSILLLFAIVNVVVTGLFAGVVLRQYIQRRRYSQLYWSIALIMAFLATLAYVFLVIVGPPTSTPTVLFRIYYFFGSSLAPSWLALCRRELGASSRTTPLLYS